MLNLVSHAKEDLQRELLAELYNPSALEELLKVRFLPSACLERSLKRRKGERPRRDSSP